MTRAGRSRFRALMDGQVSHIPLIMLCYIEYLLDNFE